MIMSLIESLTKIKDAVYGREVREAIHDGVFRANQIADGADAKADNTQIRQDAVEGFNNQVIQEMTDKDVISAPEIIQARGSKATLGQRLDETATQLTHIAKQVKSSGSDDTSVIQQAIDEVDSLGGGKVLLPDSNYIYTGDLHVKEGVMLEGSERTHLQCNATSQARIVFYNSIQMRNITFDISTDYNDDVFYFANEYLVSVNRRERSSSSVKVIIENIKAFTAFNLNTPNKTAMKFFSTRSDLANATTAGFWGVTSKNLYLSGFNTMIELETEATGWINGNMFDNVTLINFKNAVKVSKSASSLGIDYNVFKLVIQTTEHTEDIIIDPDTIGNNYTQCTVWDMGTYTNARVGTGLLKHTMNGDSYPKERYATYLLSKRYHLIGRFSRFTSFVNHVLLSVTAYGNYKTDFFIRGNDGKIERRNYGSDRLHSALKFHKKDLGNGQVELYLYNSLDVELEANVYIESFRSFYPSPMVYYDNLDGLTELTNVEDFYVPNHRVKVTSENNFTPETPITDFAYGVTYSKITGDTATNTAPEGKTGVLVTHRVDSSASLNYQEYHVLNSPSAMWFKRSVSGNDTFNDWVKMTV